ncbi:MAG: polymorphic toxin type 44 domain-containing protein [Oscillospiraceae bacterium]|nr:polymorphic toxin type 44 domain-containing protein [Oscillospiraceae bacterium]
MSKVLSIIMALLTYLMSLTTAIPTFVNAVKHKNDLSFLVTEPVTHEVSYEEYAEYYKENFVPRAGYEDPTGYKDVTEQYQKLLDENLEIAKKWRTDPGFGQIEFYKSVRDHGVWDYKRDPAHAELAEEWGLGIHERFVVYGVVMDWEIVGNINFAFTGAAAGFTPITIYTGGGIVNIKNGHADWEELEFYFDEEDDNHWISFGLGLYALCDDNYIDQCEMIDSLLTIADTRIIGFVYKIYLDHGKTDVVKAAA